MEWMEWTKCKFDLIFGIALMYIHTFVYFFRGLEDDPDGHAEMQLEQALDDNDLVYHDTMITAQ